MLKQLRNMKIIFVILGALFLNTAVFADDLTQSTTNFYEDKTRLVVQQIDLLKNRIVQAEIELKTLQKQRETMLSNLASEHFNNQMLSQASLDIATAKSNLDSVNIELAECQQAITRLEKEVQDIQNQLNVFNIFGLKIAHDGAPDVKHLRADLSNRIKLLDLEKERAGDLQKLRMLAENVLQFNRLKYTRIDSSLKSQTFLQLKEQQAKSEIGLQQQQSRWLTQLSQLDAQLVKLQNSNHQDKSDFDKLQNEIFYVNENVNFTYLKMLIARHQEQIQQLKVSIEHNSSITLLNKATEETQLLAKQLLRVNKLLKQRANIISRRIVVLTEAKQTDNIAALNDLIQQYKTEINNVAQLIADNTAFRAKLDQALQQELSARQGLPGLGAKAWLDLGEELLLVPSLVFQVFKSLSNNVAQSVVGMGAYDWVTLGIFQVSWIVLFVVLNLLLKSLVARLPDHEFGHINLKWLFIKLVHRNLVDIAVIGNLAWLLSFFTVQPQSYNIVMDLAFVWLVFKSIIMIARLCLVESVHDRVGDDMWLYRQIKWVFLLGGVVTGFTVFMHQLPIIYEVKDLFDRLFLVFLLVASMLLLKHHELIPNLILPHIDERRTYSRRVISLLGMLIPFILLVNSVIGLLGYVNLILTISWYESIFVFVLVGYLLLRGLLSDVMELVSRVLIRHVTNGWLWTEAFLKPIDRVLRVILFLSAWAVLFLLYGWDRQSPVVERLNKLLSYHLLDVLNTTITPLSIIELVVIISLLYWAVRWTREFVYRLLLSRTKDLGLRNSIAILSQYAMIVFGVFICLRLLGIDFKSLTFVVTAFAFGVGLGLRDLMNNFACGFLLLIERPLRVGDIVSINGHEGEVTHIGGRAVTMRTWDHMEVIVPNAEIFSKTFTNWTAKDNIVRTVITLNINRHDKPQDVQEVIYHILERNKDVLTDPAPEVFLKELTDGLIEFEIRYYLNLRQVKSRIGLRSEILMSIWEAFEKHGIHPPYPLHEVVVKAAATPASDV